MSTVTASQINESWDSTSHQLSFTAIQTFAADGHQQPLTLTVPGYKYDLTVALLQAMGNPAAWANGFGSLTPAQVSAWIAANPKATMPQVMAYIVSQSGPLVPADVARFYAEIANLEAMPAPPPTPPALQQSTAPDISA